MTVFAMPFASGSAGLNNIIASNATDETILKIKRKGSKFVGGADKLVINWGCTSSYSDQVNKSYVINQPAAVRIASNKRTFFETASDYCSKMGIECFTPEFYLSKEDAFTSIKSGNTLFARTVLNGHSGEGIEEISSKNVDSVTDIPDAGLYVKYVPKKYEYRYHIFNGRVIDVQEKRRSNNVEVDLVNWRVRSYENGFVYCRENLVTDRRAATVAVEAIRACGLDFGAVDIIYNKKQNKYYVLEVNTAPGVSGTTADKYKEAITSLLG